MAKAAFSLRSPCRIKRFFVWQKKGVRAGRPTKIGKNLFIGRTVSDFEGEASVEKIRLFALLHLRSRVHTATSPVSPNRLLAEKSATASEIMSAMR